MPEPSQDLYEQQEEQPSQDRAQDDERESSALQAALRVVYRHNHETRKVQANSSFWSAMDEMDGEHQEASTVVEEEELQEEKEGEHGETFGQTTKKRTTDTEKE